MASTHFLCSHHFYTCSNSKNHHTHFLRKATLSSSSSSSSYTSSYRPHGSSLSHKKFQFQRTQFVRAVSSDSKSGKTQAEIVYDIDEKLNKLADEVDDNAGLSRLTLFSPCKINVFLRITGKREDGFHDLASLFHVISLGDRIKFSLSPSKSKDRLSTNVPGVPIDDRNLIVKALNLYRKKTGADNFFWIHLEKKVPTGAGLGGGSSNAATALWAANQFSGCLATEKELQEWSSEIGSDVPFFFSQGAAYCTGRGEKVLQGVHCVSGDVILFRYKTVSRSLKYEEAIPMAVIWMLWKTRNDIAYNNKGKLSNDLNASYVVIMSKKHEVIGPSAWVGVVVRDIPPPIPFDIPMVLIKPQQACSTAEVYKRLQLDQTSKIDPLTLLEKISRNGIFQDVREVKGQINRVAYPILTLLAVFGRFINRLGSSYAEPPAFEVLPSLKRLKQRIIAAGRGQFDAVFMSGSGSTIVGIGSPDPPQFVYDDDEYKEVFFSEASFITRAANQWYTEEPISTSAGTAVDHSLPV
ncbi:hypothetical protein TEA_018752 [Camellia sinensis var. sinensis]|uniref:4-(cytidine 5'-diphospho)-2-C-methyl-D-erythritol kinase n=1 Tax=Camellia sinensis var. sinensis TaxID=542762 RepID=A0A4V6RYN5_CAMSN|nr:hypothetical protein TEA_018752 [Camellia sinensis var. sinensis]